MAFEAEIAALTEAIASGALEVETIANGVKKRVKYSSFDDLRRRLAFIQTEAAKIAGTPPLPRVALATFSKGR